MAEKILFVDDEADMCRMISDCLRLYGYEVATAENAEAARQLAEETAFDVIILDVNLADLAGRDGSNLMAAFKREHPNIPIILYTGMSREDVEVNDMIQQGAFLHVSKSETLETLLKAIQKSGKYFHQKN